MTSQNAISTILLGDIENRPRVRAALGEGRQVTPNSKQADYGLQPKQTDSDSAYLSIIGNFTDFELCFPPMRNSRKGNCGDIRPELWIPFGLEAGNGTRREDPTLNCSPLLARIGTTILELVLVLVYSLISPASLSSLK